MYRTRSGTWDFHVLTEKRSAWGQSSISWNFAAVEKGKTWTKDKSSAPIRLFNFSSKKCSTEKHIFSSVATWRWVIQRKSYENLKLVPFQSAADSDKRLGETVEIQQRNNGGKKKIWVRNLQNLFFLEVRKPIINNPSILHIFNEASTWTLQLELERPKKSLVL